MMKLFLLLLMVMTVVLESQAAAKPQYFYNYRVGNKIGGYYQPPVATGGDDRYMPAADNGWYRPAAKRVGLSKPVYYSFESDKEE